MPYYYFDSTALVKRYSMERGTRVVNKLMVKRGKVAIVPMWSVADFYSALSVRAQQGEITRDDCYSVLYKFEMEAAQGLFQFISPTMEHLLILEGANPRLSGVTLGPVAAPGLGVGAQAPTFDRGQRR